MKRKRIAITGASGTIGSVLRGGLAEYEMTPLDLPETNVRNYEKLLEVLPGHDAVIHLAWNTQTENCANNRIDPDNILMVHNVYSAALKTKVPRVIMASSVHADDFYNWKCPELMSPYRLPCPDSPYGADKVFMEALGRHYATLGLEVVCIRFGGINLEDKPSDNYHEKAAWISHNDCVALVKKCIEAKRIPDKYLIVYGVSDNKNRVHDVSNPLGWVPKDSSG